MGSRGYEIFTLDNLYHFLGGGALSLLVISGFWYPWTLTFTVPVLIATEGLLREQAQKGRDWRPSVWLIKRKIAEGVMWGVGSAVVMISIYVYYFI